MPMKRILVFAAAVASAMSLRADSSQWELVSLLPFPVSESAGEWQNSSLKSMYQTGGGFSEGGAPESQPVSQDLTHERDAFRLEHGSWGFGVSGVSLLRRLRVVAREARPVHARRRGDRPVEACRWD